MSRIIRAETAHNCMPGMKLSEPQLSLGGDRMVRVWVDVRCDPGDTWICDCGEAWVAYDRWATAGMASPGWRQETRRERRRRERAQITGATDG